MPRYFFHLVDGRREADRKGTELPNLDAAQTEAVVFAGATLKERPGIVWDGEDLQVQVEDDHGLMLLVVSVSVIRAPASSG